MYFPAASFLAEPKITQGTSSIPVTSLKYPSSSFARFLEHCYKGVWGWMTKYECRLEDVSLLKPLVGLSLLPELMEGECFEPLRTLISQAARWLLPANSGCCFLRLCLGLSCMLRLRIVQTPGFWSLYPACWLLSCLGLGKSLQKGVCFKTGWNCVIGDYK